MTVCLEIDSKKYICQDINLQMSRFQNISKSPNTCPWVSINLDKCQQSWLKSWPDLVWIGEVKILKNFQWEIFLKSVSTLLKSCSGCVKTPWSRSWLLSTVKAPRLNNNNNPNINFFLNCYKALQKECCCGAMIF